MYKNLFFLPLETKVRRLIICTAIDWSKPVTRTVKLAGWQNHGGSRYNTPPPSPPPLRRSPQTSAVAASHTLPRQTQWWRGQRQSSRRSSSSSSSCDVDHSSTARRPMRWRQLRGQDDGKGGGKGKRSSSPLDLPCVGGGQEHVSWQIGTKGNGFHPVWYTVLLLST
jgi:hypothetical protein